MADIENFIFGCPFVDSKQGTEQTCEPFCQRRQKAQEITMGNSGEMRALLSLYGNATTNADGRRMLEMMTMLNLQLAAEEGYPCLQEQQAAKPSA